MAHDIIHYYIHLSKLDDYEMDIGKFGKMDQILTHIVNNENDKPARTAVSDIINHLYHTDIQNDPVHGTLGSHGLANAIKQSVNTKDKKQILATIEEHLGDMFDLYEKTSSADEHEHLAIACANTLVAITHLEEELAQEVASKNPHQQRLIQGGHRPPEQMESYAKMVKVFGKAPACNIAGRQN